MPARRFAVTFIIPDLHLSSGGAYAIHQFARHCARSVDVNLIVEEGEPQPLDGVATYPGTVIESTKLPAADALVIPADNVRGEQLHDLPPEAGAPILFFQGYGTPQSPVVIANLKRATRVIAVATWLVNEAKRFGCNTRLVRSGLDRSIFFAGPPSSGRRPSVVMMTSHIEWKGSDDGFDAIRLARAEIPGLEIRLFGHLDPHIPGVPVLSVPHRSEIARMMRSSMILLSPSWEEGLGLPCLEAMLSGAAVVTTDSMGSRDYAIPEQTALVSEPRTPEALAHNLIRFTQDAELRCGCTERAYRLVNQRYSDWPHASAAFATALRELATVRDARPTMSSGAPWDAPSRYGRPGRALRRTLHRALRPALVRQAAVDAELYARLIAQQNSIERLQETATRRARELADLEYRVTALDRTRELDAVRTLVAGAKLPSDGARIAAVAHDWKHGEQRRALCSLATGPYASLLEIGAVTLQAYANRHRWDLVLSREDLARRRKQPWGKLPLVRDLLEHYDVVAWIDADALIVDFDHDLGDELEPGKDFYIVKQQGGVPCEEVLNSGVFVLRTGAWSQRFLDEVWVQGERGHHRWSDNAAFMRVLGYDVDEFPVRVGVAVPRMERVKIIDLAWNSIPHWARSPHPRINHWGGRPLHDRRLLMLEDLSRAMVTRVSSDPLASVQSREELPLLFNRLGFIGVGVALGTRRSTWLLHRWTGSKLISVDPEPVTGVQAEPQLVPVGDGSEIWRMSPHEALRHVGERSLDFVYLTSPGDAAPIADALLRWEPKVRAGGVIAGEGYFATGGPTGGAGVRSAVDAFCKDRHVVVRGTGADGPRPSWWIQLPLGVADEVNVVPSPCHTIVAD